MTKPAPLSEQELAAIRRSGQILAQAMQQVIAAIRRGVVATIELDTLAESAIRKLGGNPAFKGYRGYPRTICISVNDEVVHGVPRKNKILKEGAVVSLDLGVVYRGMYTDMATTVVVSRQTRQTEIIAVAQAALREGLRQVRAGATTGDIGAAVQQLIEAHDYSVVRDLVGHGVGRSIHEEPSIPNFGQPGTGSRLRSGTAIAVEPMITAGRYTVTTDGDGWTVRTADGSLAAHEERTVLVTDHGYELLTPPRWDES
ncbi:MAG: type I methionyl aminopeptidase [Candidatus Kerfeldbacteria bacterium]|nr:type I methionyl aminopeptidase [Candidatus Kerfeldbacteria bacterium]